MVLNVEFDVRFDVDFDVSFEGVLDSAFGAHSAAGQYQGQAGRGCEN